ncbi:MAG: histidinol dehydrogenase [Thermodesulfobacteriota bacterium]|nr:histidinol dehydrogenase [Thermodesulfobacteriota bacterium]
MIITPITTSSTKGQELLLRLCDRFQTADSKCMHTVSDIIAEVRSQGDEALLKYTRQFDAPDLTVEQMRVSKQELDESHNQVDTDFIRTLDIAFERIHFFHEKEKEESWTITRDDGVVTGRLVHPVESAGLYVPGGQGGTTPLVSSVLMNGIPALIAGVKRRVMATPPDRHGQVNPAILVAAKKTGITEIYKVGSAWAVAALAYGTGTIRPVDVIVGPGNQYVAEAKRQVSGRVRIDMIAGPSEVLILADESANPAFIAADMLAQAEHDPQALAMLVTTSSDIAEQVVKQLESRLASLSRNKIAGKALVDRGVILISKDVSESISIANRIAAEHLELMLNEPDKWMRQIRNAGAVFLGNHSPEAAGDYIAGPNHVLPTMGTARFSSALGVETFVKKTSLISYTRQALIKDAEHILKLADMEGLTAHAESVSIRVDGK